MRFLPKFLRSDKDQTKNDIVDGVRLDCDRQDLGDKKSECTCLVHLLDDHEFSVTLKANCKGYTLLERVLDHLELVEREYFGLRFMDQTKQTHWLDAHRTILSQLKCSPPFWFYFGVKFYSADPCKLREEVTRYQIFLQVKSDILQGRLAVTFDEAAELSAYTVQSELGDYDAGQHTFAYTSEFRFIPNQTPEFEETVAGIHRQLVGLMPAVAEYKFLDKVKWLELYGVDLHPVLGDGQLEYYLGLTPTGIVVYKNKVKVGNYFWPRILKVTNKGKIFIIKVKDRSNDEHSYAFETASKVACKHLWKCCIEHHAFFRASQSGETLKTGSGFFKWGSRARISFRREQPSPKPSRPYPTQVYRMRSRRHERRTASESSFNGQSSMESVYNGDEGGMTIVATLEPSEPYRHRSYPTLPRAGSPQSVQSVPWETRVDGGLYTSGRDSPGSVRSEKMKFPSRRGLTTSSDTELASRKKYFNGRGCSDNESDIFIPRRRRRETDTSGSDSESGYRRATHRPHHAGDTHRYASSVTGTKETGDTGRALPPPAYESANQRRKRRTRSRSPNKKPPEELKQHFEYDLIETDGMSNDQLQDIAFVSIQTKAEPFRLFYDKARRRYRSPHRTQPSGERGITVKDAKCTGDDKQSEVGSVSNQRPTMPQEASSHSNLQETRIQEPSNVTNQSPSMRQEPPNQSPKRTPDPRSYQYNSKGSTSVEHRNPNRYQDGSASTQIDDIDGSLKRGERSYVDVSAMNQRSLKHNLSVRSTNYTPEEPHVPHYATLQNKPNSTSSTNPNTTSVIITKVDNPTIRTTNLPSHPAHKHIMDEPSPRCYNYKTTREAYRNTMWKRYPSQSQPATNQLSAGYKRSSYSSSAISSQTQKPNQTPPSQTTHKLPSPASNSSYSMQTQSPQSPLSVQRPVYSWSHFQPVRSSPSPSQSGNSANLSGSFNVDGSSHRYRAPLSNPREKWTEL